MKNKGLKILTPNKLFTKFNNRLVFKIKERYKYARITNAGKNEIIW